MSKFLINFTGDFEIKFQKFFSKNKLLVKKIDKTINLLEQDPFYSSLKSHKVITKEGKKAFSSRVIGDIRLIWNYQNGVVKIIDIIDISYHSGKYKVYK